MSDLQTLDQRDRSTLQRPSSALRPFVISPDSMPTAAGTYAYPLGVADAPGLILDRVFAVTGTLLEFDGTNYYTFKPWVVRKAPAGTLDKVFVGTPRSTLATSIRAAEAFRVHDEHALKVALLDGYPFGVDVVVTGTPASAQILVKPTFQASVYIR